MRLQEIVTLAAGICLFLYGMGRSEKALKQLAGSRLREVVSHITANRGFAFILGLFATMCTQSSSAVTVMLVGFATAGLLTLDNSIGVILGTAVGTTIAVQLFAWNITRFSPVLITVGFLLLINKNSSKRHYWGESIFGFGLLFYGMQIMSDSVAGLHQGDLFKTIFSIFDSPWALMLISAAFTAVVQSSAATVAMVIGLMQSGGLGESGIGIYSAIPLVLGSNIGTCITALLASLRTDIVGRQVAWAHFFYKTVAVLVAMPFIGLFARFAQWSAPETLAAQVANVHTIFNVSAAVLFFPFAGVIARVVRMLITEKKNGKSDTGIRFIDRDFSGMPHLALSQACREIINMSGTVTRMLEQSWQALQDRNTDLLETVRVLDNTVDHVQERVTPYLAQIGQMEIGAGESKRQMLLLSAASELELIGDIISKDMLESINQYLNKDLHFSTEGQQELNSFYNRVRTLLYTALDILAGEDRTRAEALLQEKHVIDSEHESLRRSHFNRIRNIQTESMETTTIHLDILEDIRRIGSHATRICGAVRTE